MAVYLGIGSDGTLITLDNYLLKDSDNLILTAMPSTKKYKITINNITYRVNINLKDGE